VVDTCLQFFGGYGYMDEYPISRMYRDARVGTIAGGTSEILREIISRIMIDQVKYEPVYGRKAAPAASGSEKAKAKSEPESKGETPMAAQPPETIAEIFQQLPQRFRPEKAGDYRGVFHFDISGKEAGQYTVTIENGACRVQEGLHGQASCVVKTKDKTYKDIELGRANPQLAFMMGRVKVSNVSEMIKLASMFRPLKDT